MRNPFRFACLAAVSVALALILLGGDAAPCLAHPVGPYVPYSLFVEDEWGTPLRTFHKDGQTFVLGSYGQRYNVRVTNQTGVRVEAVVTVDGRDVVSGRVGDFVSERGYILDPYATLKIEGFRRNYEEVAAFRFSSQGESYSARMGTPENIGVIGVAFFPERPRPAPAPPPRLARPHYDYDRGHSYGRSTEGSAPRAERKSGLGTRGAGSADEPAAAPSPSSPPAERERSRADERASVDKDDSVNNLGTEYGEAHESHVEEVAFQRADARHPAQVIALRYDDEQGLLARGIRLSVPRAHAAWDGPEPFPRNRFAPPPP